MFENLNIQSELIPSDPRFGCGPSLVPMDFVKSLHDQGTALLGTSHRKKTVKNLVKEVQDGLTKYFDIPSDYLVAMGNGGATCLFDMIALGMVDKKIAHFTCGEFSTKWFKASNNVPWIKSQEFAARMGEGINATNVADADVITFTLNETSTGVQNVLIPEAHEGALVAVDATSGAGQIPCDISKTDIFIFSPQKVFASDGGLWIAILSPKAQLRAQQIEEDKQRYIPHFMRWSVAMNNSKKNQTYNTPAIATIYFLNEQIKLMNGLGFKKVCEMAEDKAKMLYGWAQEKPYLNPFVEEPEFRSRAVATIDVDEKYPMDDLIAVLESKKIAYGIDGYRKLGRNQLRISLFHNVTIEDLEKLTKIVSNAIESI